MKPRMLLGLVFLPAFLLLVNTAHGQEAPLQEPSREASLLYETLDSIWSWRLAAYPEFATYAGVEGHDTRWTDWSPEGVAKRQARERAFLEALERISPEALDGRAELDLSLVRHWLEDAVSGHEYPSEYLAIDQMGGVHTDVPRILAMMPSRNASDFTSRLERLRRVPRLIDETIALLEMGLQRGITPPRVTLRAVPQQIEAIMTEDVTASPLYEPFDALPEAIAPEERDALIRRARQVVADEVYPAYARLHSFLVDHYLPGARSEVGLSALPEGRSWYEYRARHYTTTDLTPEDIHEIGLREVERIRGEMMEVMKETGFEGSLDDFFVHLRTDSRFFFDDPEALVQEYRDIAKRADPELVKLFGTLPRLPYGVKAMADYIARSAPTAYYEPGSPEAGRPGYFAANTYDLASRPKWEMEALTLHEAVPGHHLQIAIAQELPDRHPLLRHLRYTVYVEGWGLYAESLGEEMGFYVDPYSRFGQLTYEMWRAVRLVVDTGIHALGWSRERAIDYFRENAGKTEHDIEVEIDRYIVWPGQALAYKIGELKIKELRQQAEARLGAAFDIRGFHDTVLEQGAVPLSVLEGKVHDWIAAQDR